MKQHTVIPDQVRDDGNYLKSIIKTLLCKHFSKDRMVVHIGP
jgi:hypothetical protein